MKYLSWAGGAESTWNSVPMEEAGLVFCVMGVASFVPLAGRGDLRRILRTPQQQQRRHVDHRVEGRQQQDHHGVPPKTTAKDLRGTARLIPACTLVVVISNSSWAHHPRLHQRVGGFDGNVIAALSDPHSAVANVAMCR